MRTSHSPKSCFTLIELLVVISIIAILAGMLLPALGQAKARSLATECSGKLKTLAQGTLHYGMDYDDWILAPKNNDKAEGNIGGWYNFLIPYLGDGMSPYNHTPEKAPMRYCKMNKVANGGKANLARCSAFGWGKPTKKYSKVKRPSDFIGYSDASEYLMFNNVGPTPMVTGTLSGTTRVMVFPHNLMANASFLDAHVGPEHYSDMMSGKVNFQGNNIRKFNLKVSSDYIYK